MLMGAAEEQDRDAGVSAAMQKGQVPCVERDDEGAQRGSPGAWVNSVPTLAAVHSSLARIDGGRHIDQGNTFALRSHLGQFRPLYAPASRMPGTTAPSGTKAQINAAKPPMRHTPLANANTNAPAAVKTAAKMSTQPGGSENPCPALLRRQR